MPHRHALPVLRLCCETVVWVLTGRCACNKRGASEEPGDSEGKNIDGVFTISLMVSGANMSSIFWLISSMSSFLANLNKQVRSAARDTGYTFVMNQRRLPQGLVLKQIKDLKPSFVYIAFHRGRVLSSLKSCGLIKFLNVET